MPTERVRKIVNANVALEQRSLAAAFPFFAEVLTVTPYGVKGTVRSVTELIYSEPAALSRA